MQYSRINALVIIILGFFLISCAGLIDPLSVPPYVITEPVSDINGRPGYFTYAGIVFEFMNTASKNIDKITVSFMLFDSNTQASPFVGSNKFEITRSALVLAGETKEIIISLDQYIYAAPSKPYLIDFFYISEIHYLDGSYWQDKNGLYRRRAGK